MEQTVQPQHIRHFGIEMLAAITLIAYASAACVLALLLPIVEVGEPFAGIADFLLPALRFSSIFGVLAFALLATSAIVAVQVCRHHFARLVRVRKITLGIVIAMPTICAAVTLFSGLAWSSGLASSASDIAADASRVHFIANLIRCSTIAVVIPILCAAVVVLRMRDALHKRVDNWASGKCQRCGYYVEQLPRCPECGHGYGDGDSDDGLRPKLLARL